MNTLRQRSDFPYTVILTVGYQEPSDTAFSSAWHMNISSISTTPT